MSQDLTSPNSYPYVVRVYFKSPRFIKMIGQCAPPRVVSFILEQIQHGNWCTPGIVVFINNFPRLNVPGKPAKCSKKIQIGPAVWLSILVGRMVGTIPKNQLYISPLYENMLGS